MGEVVAAAIVQDGRLLLAQRTRPAELAGLWELPGGKVEDGETPADAVRRELAEELGVTATAGGRVGADVPLGDGLVLCAYLARIESGTAVPIEHAALRWVTASQLVDIELVPNDRIWLADLLELLRHH